MWYIMQNLQHHLPRMPSLCHQSSEECTIPGITCQQALYSPLFMYKFHRLLNLSRFWSKPSTRPSLPLRREITPRLTLQKSWVLKRPNSANLSLVLCSWPSIGHFDIAMAVMSMSSFCAMPHHSHIDYVKRIYGYLANMNSRELQILTSEPDFSELPGVEYDWAKAVMVMSPRLSLRMSLPCMVTMSHWPTTMMPTLPQHAHGPISHQDTPSFQ